MDPQGGFQTSKKTLKMVPFERSEYVFSSRKDQWQIQAVPKNIKKRRDYPRQFAAQGYLSSGDGYLVREGQSVVHHVSAEGPDAR